MSQNSLNKTKVFLKTVSVTITIITGLVLIPVNVTATQLHAGSEGVITHQIGHLFFLFSMIALIFTITGKGLNKQAGWRCIQYSAFFFILWNLCAVSTHFLDNQLNVITMASISLGKVRLIADNNSQILAWIYYILKLDHLLCVPAMLFLYRGLSKLVDNQRQIMIKRDIP